MSILLHGDAAFAGILLMNPTLQDTYMYCTHVKLHTYTLTCTAMHTHTHTHTHTQVLYKFIFRAR